MKKLQACLLSALLVSIPLFAAATFDGTAGKYFTSTNLPNEDNVSVTFWTKVTTLTDSTQFLNLNGATATIWSVVMKNLAGTYHFATGTNVATTTGAVTLTTGVWHFVAFRRSGNTKSIYLDGSTTADATDSSAETAGAEDRFTVGAKTTNATANSWCACTIAAVKVWNAYLSPEQLSNEMNSYRPKTTTSLFIWSPMFIADSPSLDFSGGAKSLTLTATVTATDGPPISW